MAIIVGDGDGVTVGSTAVAAGPQAKTPIIIAMDAETKSRRIYSLIPIQSSDGPCPTITTANSTKIDVFKGVLAVNKSVSSALS